MEIGGCVAFEVTRKFDGTRAEVQMDAQNFARLAWRQVNGITLGETATVGQYQLFTAKLRPMRTAAVQNPPALASRAVEYAHSTSPIGCTLPPTTENAIE